MSGEFRYESITGVTFQSGYWPFIYDMMLEGARTLGIGVSCQVFIMGRFSYRLIVGPGGEVYRLYHDNQKERIN